MKTTVLTIYFITICLFVGAADRPRLRDVTAVPKFEKRDDATHLLIEDGKELIVILWSLELRGERDHGKSLHYFPVTLAPDTRYKFSIEEQRYSLLSESGITVPGNIDREQFMNTNRTLVRISRDDAVLFDREVCEIHHRKMRRINAPIIYGLIVHVDPQPTLEETQTRFPHHRKESFGGCAVMPKKTKLMFVCSDCKVAHEKWKKGHPSQKK